MSKNIIISYNQVIKYDEYVGKNWTEQAVRIQETPADLYIFKPPELVLCDQTLDKAYRADSRVLTLTPMINNQSQ